MIRNSTDVVANLVTSFQDLVAKVKNLVALAPVLGAILRPGKSMGLHLCKVLLYRFALISSEAYLEVELILGKSHIRLKDLLGASK